MKLTITDADSNAFANGAYKKDLWSNIRRRHAIPSSLKLGVNNVSGTPNYRELYVKGTDPRQYLHGDVYGRFSHATADTSPVIGSAPVAVQSGSLSGTAPAVNGRFAAANSNGQGSWSTISRGALLDLLRDDDLDIDVAHRVDVPEGFPTNLGPDAVVLDSSSGSLYFRA